MGKLKTFTRRAFLVGSAAVAGGVAFGVYSVRKDPANPLTADLKEGDVTFNPWVLMDAEKVTLITPHNDIGQGVVSSQAALIAEEMDLEWGGFETSFGGAAQAYWNTALAHEMVPFLPWDESFGKDTMVTIMSAMSKMLPIQVTGGSSAMPDSYTKLREAGAMARETIKAAAARVHGVSVADLKTAGGKVILPDGTQVPYTDLAAEAGKQEPVSGVALRDPNDWKLVGHDMLRLDIVAKSTGTQAYGIDVKLPNMVYASVRANPYKGGAMNGFDASDAKKMPGVKEVLEVGNGVAVVADNSWNAIQAVNAVDVDWAAGDYPADQAEHWKAVEASFSEESLDQEWLNTGDVEADNGEAVEAEYRAPYVAHQPLEPLNATVLVSDDGAEVWTGHQVPGYVIKFVAEKAGLDEAQVTLHNQYSGGSFGHRLEFEHVKQAAEIAAQMQGTPVQLVYSREEDFLQDFTRQIGMARGKAQVKDGKVTSYAIDVATSSASRSQSARMGLAMPGPDAQIVAGVWNQPYDFENHRVRAYAVDGLAPVSSWRSVGASTGGFFSECLLDEAIIAAGADPMDERIRLCTLDEVSRKVLEEIKELSNWGEELPAGTGKGVALVHSFGLPCAEVVQVTKTEAGIKIDKVWVVADVGKVIDPINFENMMMGGAIWGLGHAMNSEITYADGAAEQENYYAHEGMRLHQTPEFVVKGLENGKVKGIGEPPVTPAAPALANAIFAATGERVREMPFGNHIDFV